MEMMRLTAFPAAGAHPGPSASQAPAWWSRLFDTPPEELRQDLQSGVTQLRGVVDDVFLLATENPVSFELKRLASHPNQPRLEAPALQPFGAVVGAFEEQVVRWLTLPDCPPLRRLAFGATLLIPVADEEAANTALDRFLPQVSLDPQAADFVYQINRRRTASSVENLALNRLSKWTIEAVQGVVLSPDGAVAMGPGSLACRLDLDMNSVPSREPIPKARLPHLFSELVALGTEIATQGDIE